MLKKKSPTEIKPRGWSESMAPLYLWPSTQSHPWISPIAFIINSFNFT